MDAFGARAQVAGRARQGHGARTKSAARRSRRTARTLRHLRLRYQPQRSQLRTRSRVAEWDEHTRLQNEKEVLGFFVSGHPMDKYREKLRNMKVVDTATAVEMKPEPQVFRRGRNEEPQNEIAIAGVITGLKVAKSKRSGELYAQAALEDTTGKIELIAFPQSYEKLAEKLKIDVPVLVRGRPARRRRLRPQARHLQHPGP